MCTMGPSSQTLDLTSQTAPVNPRPAPPRPGPLQAPPPPPPPPPDEMCDDTCVICYDATATCVFLECGHGGFCRRCAHLLFVRPPNECPTCRQRIEQVGAGVGCGSWVRALVAAFTTRNYGSSRYKLVWLLAFTLRPPSHATRSLSRLSVGLMDVHLRAHLHTCLDAAAAAASTSPSP